MRSEPAGSKLPGPHPMDWNGVVMHHSMVLHWSIGGSDSGSALLGGAALPAGATRMLQHPQEDPAISCTPQTLACAIAGSAPTRAAAMWLSHPR